ncbi:MAG: hypothetical protein ACI4DR_05845 [Roseburia sp.]
MILCTSDIDIFRRAAKTAFVYLLLSLLCALFGAVYESFSHEVYSFSMIYAFAFPLAGGTLPFLGICLFRFGHYPGTLSGSLYHCGIATVTVGSIVKGILDIYGTTNRFTRLYWYVGGLLLLGGILVFFIQMAKQNNAPYSGTR